MGFPLSTFVANIYMEYCETMDFNSFPLDPIWLLRYVDDTIMNYMHGKDRLGGFFIHLNSISKHHGDTKKIKSCSFLTYKSLERTMVNCNIECGCVQANEGLFWHVRCNRKLKIHIPQLTWIFWDTYTMNIVMSKKDEM